MTCKYKKRALSSVYPGRGDGSIGDGPKIEPTTSDARCARATSAAPTMVEYEARGITVRDVAPAVFIEAYALHLKNSDRFEIPKWTDLVKTGVHKELGPTDDDWYFVRAASIARKVYLKPGVGVGALRKWYGGQYRRGARANAPVLCATLPVDNFAGTKPTLCRADDPWTPEPRHTQWLPPQPRRATL